MRKNNRKRRINIKMMKENEEKRGGRDDKGKSVKSRRKELVVEVIEKKNQYKNRYMDSGQLQVDGRR